MSLKMSLGCISPAEDGPWCPLNMVWKSLLSKLKLKHITVQELFAALRCNSKKKRKEEKAGCIVFVATQKCPFSFYKPKPRERFVGVFRKSADPQWGWIFQNPQDEFSEVWLSGNKKKKWKNEPPKSKTACCEPGSHHKILSWRTTAERSETDQMNRRYNVKTSNCRNNCDIIVYTFSSVLNQ